MEVKREAEELVYSEGVVNKFLAAIITSNRLRWLFHSVGHMEPCTLPHVGYQRREGVAGPPLGGRSEFL